VFVENHDNQRGHSSGDPIIHGQAGLYRLSNAFMLAWPYERPKLMSSDAVTNSDIGLPKAPAGDVLPCTGTMAAARRPGAIKDRERIQRGGARRARRDGCDSRTTSASSGGSSPSSPRLSICEGPGYGSPSERIVKFTR